MTDKTELIDIVALSQEFDREIRKKVWECLLRTQENAMQIQREVDAGKCDDMAKATPQSQQLIHEDMDGNRTTITEDMSQRKGALREAAAAIRGK